MSFILRIIDQTGKNSEETTETILGETYTATMKVANDTELLPEGENKFRQAINAYYKDLGNPVPNDKYIDETVVGVVSGVNKTILIRSHQVAYIVHDTGATHKRLYGQHKRY